MAQSIGPGLRDYWRRLSALPPANDCSVACWVTTSLTPVTLGATVELLEPGQCIVTLRERRELRNHLDSVHAMALADLGEMATGLALMNSLPEQARGILKHFHIDYLKKARGLLTADCRCEIPDGNQQREIESLL